MQMLIYEDRLATFDLALTLFLFATPGVCSAQTLPEVMPLQLHGAIMRLEIASLSGYADQVSYVGFSVDSSKLASYGFEVGATVWDMATGSDIIRIPGRLGAVSFSPDGTKLAGQNQDRKVRVWDVASGAEITELEHADWVNSTCFSPDGTKLLSGGEEELKLWDLTKGTEIVCSKDFVRTVSFSPDGTKFAAGRTRHATGIGYHIIELWDVAKKAKIATFRTHTNKGTRIESVSFSPDGTKLLSGTEYGIIYSDNADKGGELGLWDIEEGVVKTLCEPPLTERVRNDIRAVTFSPDGRMIAVALRDGTVKLRDASSGAKIATLQGHIDDVMSIAFSAGGAKLASGSKDGTILIWDMNKYADAKPKADSQGWEREEPIIDEEAYEKEQQETLAALQREWEPWFADGIREYRPYGFFSSVKTDEYIQKRAEELAAKYARQGRKVPTYKAYLELVYAEPTNNIYWFDTECIGGAGSYVNILKKLSEITGGIFQPTDISDIVDGERKQAGVSFVYKGQKYSFVLKLNDDWADISLLPKLNQVLRGASKQFYLYKQFDQTAFVVFISPEQKRRLEEEKEWEFAY